MVRILRATKTVVVDMIWAAFMVEGGCRGAAACAVAVDQLAGVDAIGNAGRAGFSMDLLCMGITGAAIDAVSATSESISGYVGQPQDGLGNAVDHVDAAASHPVAWCDLAQGREGFLAGWLYRRATPRKTATWWWIDGAGWISAELDAAGCAVAPPLDRRHRRHQGH